VPVYFTLLHEKNALFSILLISLNSCTIQFANTTEKKNLHIDTLNTYIKNYLPNEVGKEQVVLTLEPITTDNILEICLKNKYTLVLFSYPCPTTIDYVRETILLAKKIEESKAYEFKFIIASATYDIDFYKQVHNFYKKTFFLDEYQYGNTILKKITNFNRSIKPTYSKQEAKDICITLFNNKREVIYIGSTTWNSITKKSEILNFDELKNILKE